MIFQIFKSKPKKGPQPHSDRPFHVLVVDDDHEILQMYSEFLEGGGYIPTVVASAPDAVQLIRTVPVDVILLDVYLGQANGIELVKDLRKLGFSQPVILCSGLLSHFEASSNELNIVDFLHKPVSPEALIESLQRIRRKAG